MSIREDSKKIIQFLLRRAIEHGTMQDRLAITFEALANETHLENEKYCRICCEYLSDLGCIKMGGCDSTSGPSFVLNGQAIDFLEPV